jgi:hypothetical protein
MAVPSYATDLVDITLSESTTSWTALGGGASGLSVEPDFTIQGSNSIAKQIKAELKGHHFSNGATAQSATDHVFVWLYVSTPGTTDTLALGGLRVTIGTASTARKEFYVAGNDTYTKGGWFCYPIRYSLTPDNTVGSPGATPSFFGSTMNGTVTVKAPNLAVDAMRYGTNVQLTDGEVANPGTLVGLAQYADNTTRSWGLIQEIPGGVLVQGEAQIGTSGSLDVYYDESNIQIIFPNNNPSGVVQHTLSTFKEVSIDGLGTTANFTSVSFLSLDTTDKGKISVNSTTTDVILDSCSFQNLGTITINIGTILKNSSLLNCSTIIRSAGTISDCTFTSQSATFIATDSIAEITGNTFENTGLFHAIQLDSLGVGTMIWDNTDTGYASVNGSVGDETIFVNVASGSLTIDVAEGSTVPTIRTAGAVVTVNPVQRTATFTLDPLITGYEWRLYTDDLTPGIIGTVELAGEETAISSVQTYTYTYSADIQAVLQIIASGYEESQTTLILGDADIDRTILLTKETNT